MSSGTNPAKKAPRRRPKAADPANCLKQAADAAQVELLDTDWQGAHGRYRLRCTAGHVWVRSASQITTKAPVACPVCRDLQRLARVAAAAERNGSVCLNTAWRGPDANYRFRCAHGHLWERSAKNVLYRTGGTCPQCERERTRARRRLADGLERLHAAAAAHGGQCLDGRYLGTEARYRFRCREGHEWETTGTEVLRGSWCLPCSHAERSRAYLDAQGLARLRAAAEAKGGVCLSEAYTGQKARYRFRCAKGHEWEAPGNSVLRGTWCRCCENDALRTDIAVLKAIAAERGGQCLSPAYTSSRIKLSWMCHKGHVWQALARTIRAGHWCPVCAHANKIKRTDSKARMRYREASR